MMSYDEAMRTIRQGGMAWRRGWEGRSIMWDNGPWVEQVSTRHPYLPTEDDRRAHDWDVVQ